MKAPIIDMSQEPVFVEIDKKHEGPQSTTRHFVRARAVETHMDISQEVCCVKNDKKNAGPQSPARYFL